MHTLNRVHCGIVPFRAALCEANVPSLSAATTPQLCVRDEMPIASAGAALADESSSAQRVDALLADLSSRRFRAPQRPVGCAEEREAYISCCGAEGGDAALRAAAAAAFAECANSA